MFLFIFFFLFTPCQCVGEGENVHEETKKLDANLSAAPSLRCIRSRFVRCYNSIETTGNRPFAEQKKKSNAQFHRALETKLCACVALTLSNVVPKALFCLQRCLAFASCGTREGSEAVAAASQLHTSSNPSQAYIDWILCGCFLPK